MISVKCYALLPLFLCSLYTPFCNSSGHVIRPCKTLCKEAVIRCGFFLDVFTMNWPFDIDCDQYIDDSDPDVCVGYQENELLKLRNKACGADGFQCDQHRCLPRSWYCDGFLDCKDGTDEAECGQCTPEQFHCGQQFCIDKRFICDGERHCPDGRDERQCLRLQQQMGNEGRGRLEAWSALTNTWQSVCGENWSTDTMSRKACRLLGYRTVVETRLSDETKNGGGAHNRLGQELTKTMFYKGRQSGCVNGNQISVHLTCGHFECGRSAISMQRSTRIVGGIESKPGQWPWLVGLHGGPSEIFFCAGILISQWWVLSAAHCIGNQTNTAGWTLKLVSGIYMANDMALLLLERPVDFDEFLRPVCLPTGDENLLPNTNCTVIGWGKEKHDANEDYLKVIHHVSVPILNQSVCADWYHLQDDSITIEDNMLCAGYPEGKKDACQGDSGGPLLCRRDDNAWFVAGVVSWGINCAQPNLPGIYANVVAMRQWIDETTRDYEHSVFSNSSANE